MDLCSTRGSDRPLVRPLARRGAEGRTGERGFRIAAGPALLPAPRASASADLPLPGFFEGELDQLVELRERLRAAHEVAVDREARGSPDFRLVGDRLVLVDVRLVGVVVEGVLELAHVEAHVLSDLLEGRALDV